MERDYSRQYQRQEAAERYEKKIYKAGGHDDVIWSVEQKLLERLIRRNCPDPSHADTMDFACGTGRVTSYLSTRRGDLVGALVGVDISQEMLDFARPKVGDVPLIRADIVNDPASVPGEKDIITSFRFLLLAESTLRVAVVRELVKKLRDSNSILVFSLHGNPNSYRKLAEWRNRLFRPSRPKLPNFGLADLRDLADKVGLEIVDASGAGYLPHSVAKCLPRGLFRGFEKLFGGWPIFWRFGSNLLVVCKRKD